MTKKFATLFGIVYDFMGIAGLFDTTIVGTRGFFAANTSYSLVFVVIGSLLLIGAVVDYARETALVAGTVLVIAALAGLLIVPAHGALYGLLVNMADHVANLALGASLTIAALLEGVERAPRAYTYRYAPSDRAGTYRRYARYARHA